MELKNLKKHKYKILAVLTFISLISSIFLSIYALEPNSAICDITEGCFTVANSEYSKTLGIENAYIGLVFFIILFAVILSHIRKPNKNKEKIITYGVIIGGLWAIYSLYLMEFVIDAYCKYCTIIDVSALLAVLVISLLRK